MKTPPFTHYTGMSDPALEAVLEAAHKEILDMAEEKAIHYAKQNRPYPAGDSEEIYIGDINAKCEEMKARVGQQLLPESAATEAKMLKEESTRKVKVIQQKGQETETNKHNLELDLKKKGISLDQIKGLKIEKTFDILIMVINCAEVALNTGGLQLIGNNWLMSLVISIGITGALFVLAKQVGKHLKEDTGDARMKKIIAIGASLLALGVFYLIATLRAEHLQTEHYKIHPIFLVLLNLLFYAVTVWHYHRTTKSPSEEKEQEYLRQTKEKLENYDKQISESEEQEKSILDETAQKLNLLMHKPTYAKWLTERISMWNKEAIEKFKSVNLAYRSDRKSPDFFRKK